MRAALPPVFWFSHERNCCIPISLHVLFNPIPVRLKFNYRSGKRLISASQAALQPDEPRNYEADPQQKDAGEVLFIKGESEEDQPGVIVVEAIPELLARNFNYGEIVLFYKRRGVFLSTLVEAFESADIPFVQQKE